MPITNEKILEIMRARTYRPLLIKELMQALGVPKEERHTFKHALRSLIVSGEVIKIRGNRYGLPEKMNLVTGKLSAHPDGYGFVMPEKQGEPDVYINARNLMGAMHGDKVIARIEGEKGPGRREGRVIRVLERGFDRVVGKYVAGRGFGVVVSTNPKITQEFYVGPKNKGEAKDGDMVVGEVIRYPEPHLSPEASITKVMGRAGDPALDTDLIIQERGLATEFSPAALDDARKTPQKVTAAMRKGRRDLRGVKTVTIDGERARDFDDAVGVELVDGGLIRLFVSIADVANYVKEGTALDDDANARATSVYFPDRVLPMLPEELSNGICSLNPNVERLTLTSEMVFNDKGERVSYELYESVIKSDHRMTYTDVSAIVEKDDPEVKAKYPEFIEDFMLMHRLMKILNKMRRERGSIDFDLPEPEVIIGLRGETTGIIRSERNEAHRLIEEFMLAANETVAAHLEAHGVPFLYRIHEEPDEEKMQELAGLVKEFGIQWPTSGKVRPMHLMQVLSKLEGRPEERFINTLVLRSMKQARYSPDNAGHFGLASRCYCHFTSPIRRYPDLNVHRALKELLKGGEIKADRKAQMVHGLSALGQHTSFMEREADEAEREVVQLKKLQFMVHRVGLEFPASISGVTAFGVFVELDEYFVEGLVRLTSLYDDYYRYDEARHALVGENTGRVLRLGDRLDVRLERVDMERRQMDFVLAGTEGGQDWRREPVWVKYRGRGKGRR